MTAFWTKPFFVFDTLLLHKDLVSAQIVHVQGNLFIPDLLLKLFDILHTQWRHIEPLCEELWCQKINFWQNDSVLNLATFWTLFFLIRVFVVVFFCAQVHARGNQLVLEFLLTPSDTLRTQCRYIDHLHEEVWCHKSTFWQNGSVLNLAIFFFYTLLLYKGFVSAQIVHARGNQLVLFHVCLLCLCLDSAYAGKSTCTRAFTEAFWYFWYNTDILACAWRGVMQKITFWQNGCLSNLAILHDTCTDTVVHMWETQLAETIW